MTKPQLLSAWAGHYTGDGTGVTVILPPPGTVGSGEVRGGAPATREFPLLDPTRLVNRVDAVVLSGGSAFGLAAADGVMGVLRERGAGVPTPAGPVPIVIGMSIFDASVQTGPPDAGSGRTAALAALDGADFATGRVGAGTGAGTGLWRGRRDPGGIGWAERSAGPARVGAVVVVNAWGDVLGPTGEPLFGPGSTGEPPFGVGSAGEPPVGLGPTGEPPFGRGSVGGSSSGVGSAGGASLGRGSVGGPLFGVGSAGGASLGRGSVGGPSFGVGSAGGPALGLGSAGGRSLGPGSAGEPALGEVGDVRPQVPFGMQNTTVGVILTNARLSKTDCFLLAQSGHTGFARTIHPAHSRYDGDAVVALATGEVDAEEAGGVDLLRAVAVDAMIAAIRAAVSS